MEREEEFVILVDKDDRAIGRAEKMEAHEKGLLHRAFSVFLFNDAGELLIQQRADHKYHTAGQWSNTCCSHPAPGETVANAAARRLIEEMNIEAPVKEMFKFRYRAELENGLIENEMDNILFGNYNDDPHPNPEEVKDWRYISFDKLRSEISENENLFTPWFRLVLDKVEEAFNQKES